MPDIRNYDINDKGLKHADSDKSGSNNPQPLGALPKVRKSGNDVVKKIKVARKRMPIVVDIIIAILLALMIGAVAVGGFYAFRYFTVDYDTVDVEYSVIISDATGVESLKKNDSVYSDIDGNTVHFGKIKSIGEDANGNKIIVIAHTVSYKADWGYSIGSEKLAVGCAYALRTEKGAELSGTVVEFVNKTVLNSEKGGK